MILGTNPLVLVIVGVALGAALMTLVRRHGKRNTDIARYVLAIIAAAWVAIDFIITPAHRVTNGVVLIVLALVWVAALGYQRFRGSKTPTRQSS